MNNLHVAYSPLSSRIYIIKANKKRSKGNMIVADDKIDVTAEAINTVVMHMDGQIKDGDNALEITFTDGPKGKLIWERDKDA